jgi:hypothetical protein
LVLRPDAGAFSPVQPTLVANAISGKLARVIAEKVQHRDDPLAATALALASASLEIRPTLTSSAANREAGLQHAAKCEHH